MQSVLAIPFVVAPVADAVGEVAPSADGAFLMSFAAEAPNRPRTGEAVVDTAGVVIVTVQPFPLALVAGSAGPVPDGTLPAMVAAVRDQAAGLTSDAGLQGVAVVEAEAGGFSTLAEVRAGAEVGLREGVPGLDHSPPGQDPDGAADGGPGALARLPDAAVAGGHDLSLGTAPVVLAGAAIVGIGRTIAADAWGNGALAASDAGSELLAPNAENDRIPPASTAHGAEVQPASSAQPSEVGRTAPEDARATGATQASGLPIGPIKALLPAHEAGGVWGVQDLNAVGNRVLATRNSGDPAWVAEGFATVVNTGGEDRMADPAPTKTEFAPTHMLPSGVRADAQDLDILAAQPSGLTATLDATPGAESRPLPTPRPETAPSAAGFWERLLTGLSTTLPDDRALHLPVDANGLEADHASGRLVDPAVDVPAVGIPAPPNAIDRAASGLAVFARGQAQLSALAAEPVVEGEAADLTAVAFSTLAGTPVQGLSLPQASPAGLSQLPVPQVAAQISAALSQSADGVTELALSPEELGKVRLRLERDATHPDRMVVHITFERPETLDLFRRHAGELAEALREAGYAGADIGFDQQDSGAGTSDRSPEPAAHDYWPGAPGLADARAPEPSAPRLMAGTSLDLRL